MSIPHVPGLCLFHQLCPLVNAALISYGHSPGDVGQAQLGDTWLSASARLITTPAQALLVSGKFQMDQHLVHLTSRVQTQIMPPKDRDYVRSVSQAQCLAQSMLRGTP